MSADSIKVVARFRPVNKREQSEGDGPGSARIIVDFTAPNSFDLENHLNPEAKKHTFNFDHVIPTDWTQKQVYETTARPLLDDIFNGINCAAIFYGQTGAGKTFSSFGLKTPEGRGVVPRISEDIFHRIAETPDVEFTIKVSYVEIYNESIRDLLDTTKVNLKVRSSNNAVWVEDVTQEYVKSAEEIQEVINRGASSRAVASTAMNAESSRSHSTLLITIGQKSARGVTGAKLTIVDLAGSERISKTGAQGTTLKEAQNINKSLSALGNVINALSTPPKPGEKVFVPYRDSKLTWLLSDCLGGSSKTVMFLAQSPCYFNLPETYSTCLFGQRCKTIKNKVVVNQHLSEAEYQRLLVMKDSHIMMLANILGDVYQKLTNVYTNVSQVDLEDNQGVPEVLSPYQRGQIAVQPEQTKHLTWDQYKNEWEPSPVDVPVLIQAVEDKKDLEKVFAGINTTGLATLVAISSSSSTSPTPSTEPSTPLPPPPTSYLSIDPTLDLPPPSEHDPNDESMMSPSDMPDLMSPVPKDEDGGEVINLDNLDLNKQLEDAKIEAIEPIQASSSSSSLGVQTTPGLIIRDRAGSVELAAGQLKLFTTGAGAGVTETASTPTDQVLSLLRSHFNRDAEKTQEILDSLLTATNSNDDVASKVLLSLTGQLTPAPVVAKKKVVKKKAAASSTHITTTITTNADAIGGGDDDEQEQQHPQQQQQQQEPLGDDVKDNTDDKKPSTGGKKVVKKVIKKVVKKSIADTTFVIDNEQQEEQQPEPPQPEPTTTEIEQATVLDQPDAKVQEEQPQQQQLPTTPLIESVISDYIFANTTTANFATYSPHSSDDDDSNEDITNTKSTLDDVDVDLGVEPTQHKIVFDDDDDDDFVPTIIVAPSDEATTTRAATTSVEEDMINATQISRTDSESGSDDDDARAAAVEAAEALRLQREQEDEERQLQLLSLQRQLAESQLHIQSLKLQNDLLKEQQQDLENQATSAAQKAQLPPQQQQVQFEIKEKQLTVQNEALSIALERKCRDLIKSEVRLSSCVYHIERLEEGYQVLGQEKAELTEKLAQSQHQVTSVHSLSQQLLKTAKYWQHRAEKAEEQAKAAQTVTGGSALLPKASVGATIPPKTPQRNAYQPPPDKATLNRYTKTGDMKQFF